MGRGAAEDGCLAADLRQGGADEKDPLPGVNGPAQQPAGHQLTFRDAQNSGHSAGELRLPAGLQPNPFNFQQCRPRLSPDLAPQGGGGRADTNFYQYSILFPTLSAPKGPERKKSGGEGMFFASGEEKIAKKKKSCISFTEKS